MAIAKVNGAKLTCPWCLGKYAVHNGRMVLHGLKYGSHGRDRHCRGVGRISLDESPTDAIQMLDSLEDLAERLRQRLADIDSGRLDKYPSPPMFDGPGQGSRPVRRGEPGFELARQYVRGVVLRRLRPVEARYAAMERAVRQRYPNAPTRSGQAT